ncbi:MAG: pyridine nucleotide-disulfide oxidoreductase [Omnitrophica WOR_2 bacterium GWF2_38_59]|nr:MAG: pyridine nucleotide-disulfide oxidoreductase [Omnitrophica WOR_2 bacterium GWF2_38_59]OGX55181.1 MAG: pyridine nucleotide-disulfide oxidoreductase [Omnitrophica WOR_2 bacterium RIFOXYB2_FULL_38_16]HBG61660.1 pyridine nucleotide-disulfide oxidoreductase [Candidatus Omnitrophota bacterium]
MEKKVDVLILGGGPAGIITAVTARNYYPDKNIAVMKDVEQGVIPCGIPYMFASLKNPEENKLGNATLDNNKINCVIDKAVKIHKDSKTVLTDKGDTYSYNKLVLAVGSTPVNLPIPGIDKKGVYSILKDLNYLKEIITEIKQCKRILVLGGGFIGVEFADELAKLDDKEVTLVEMLPSILANSFDPEFSKIAENKLKEAGVNVKTGISVKEILGDQKVEKVMLSDGSELEIDAIILGVGFIPEVHLAREAGLECDKRKGIFVDEYMRTSDPDIFAVGDCAGKRDFYTQKPIPVMLASTATAEARIAGANLYKIKVIRENKGTIAIYSTYLDGISFGSAGLTEKTALDEGFEITIGSVDGVDMHPGTLPGASKSKVRLIFSKQSGIILGGQVCGGMSCAQIINIIGVAIQKRMSCTELETLQMATHPYLTSSPTVYPLVVAAQNAGSNMRL